MGKTHNYDGSQKLNPDDVAIPCGLVAKSYFNDNFINLEIDNVRFEPNIKDIAQKADKELKYKNVNLTL